MPNKNRGLFALSLALFVSCQSNPYQQGKTLYGFHCAGCHMEDGSGLGKLIPRLDESMAGLKEPNTLICLIKTGRPLNPSTGQQMPANKTLTETEMTNLVNFLGHQYKAIPQWVKTAETQKMYAACQTH